MIRSASSVRPDLTIIALLITGLGGIFAAASSGTALAFAIGLIVVGLLWAAALRPEIATHLVAFALYTNAAIVAVQFHGVPGFAAQALLFLLVAPLGHALFLRKEPIVITPALPWIGAFFIVQLLSAIGSSDPNVVAVEVQAFFAEGLVLYVLITNVVRTSGALIRLTWVLLAAGASLGALSAFQALTGSGDVYWGFAQVSGSRTSGPIGDPNYYAQVLLMVLPIGIVKSLTEPGFGHRPWALACTIAIVLGILLTYSRGAAVGVAIVLVAMVLMRYVRTWHVVLIGIGIVFLLAAFPAYAGRLATLEAIGTFASGGLAANDADGSVRSRTTENLAAFRTFAGHPLLGVGLGQFPQYYQQYANEIGLQVHLTEREAHSLYLGLAAETGILGLITFFGALGVTLSSLRHARRDALIAGRPELAHLAVAFSLALIGYAVTGLFLHLAFARYFWFVLAVGGAVASVTLGEVGTRRRGLPVNSLE